MNAGSRRHRVLLQSAVDTQDTDTGEPIRTWTDIGHWHCEIEPLSTREGLIDGGVNDEMDTRLRGNYSRTVIALRSKDRAVADIDGVTTYYNFVGIPRIASDKTRVEIRAKSGLNAG